LVKQDVTQEVFINPANNAKSKDRKKRKGFFHSSKEYHRGIEHSKKRRKVCIEIGRLCLQASGRDRWKVTQLIEYNNQLLAAGIFGVSTIEATKSTPITLAPVRSVYISNSLGELLASTLEDE